MNKILLAFIVCSFTLNAKSQSLLWSKTYGSANYDGAQSMVITSDEGIVLGGFASYAGYEQANLMKTDSAGNQIWSKSYFSNSGTSTTGTDVQQTMDGGFILTGRTYDGQAILVKTDSSGNAQWEKTYEYPNGQGVRAHAVSQTADSGYIVAGQVWTMHGQFGNYDFLVFKTDKFGTVEWMEIYFRENEKADVALSVQQLSDGGFIIGGFTQSSIWASYIIRTDSLGNVKWSEIYPGPWQSECYDIQATPDGGFIMTGVKTSYDTDGDLFITKLDSAGNEIWNKVYGTVESESGASIHQLNDGGYLISGKAVRGGGLVGSYNMYVVRTNNVGDTIWTRTIGGSGDDRGFAGMKANQSGAIYIAGATWSFGQGYSDIYLAKLNDQVSTSIEPNNFIAKEILIKNSPNPFSNATRFDIQVPEDGHYQLKVLDITGKLIAIVMDRKLLKDDSYSVEFDGVDLQSGTYLYSLTGSNFHVTKQLVLIK